MLKKVLIALMLCSLIACGSDDNENDNNVQSQNQFNQFPNGNFNGGSCSGGYFGNLTGQGNARVLSTGSGSYRLVAQNQTAANYMNSSYGNQSICVFGTINGNNINVTSITSYNGNMNNNGNIYYNTQYPGNYNYNYNYNTGNRRYYNGYWYYPYRSNTYNCRSRSLGGILYWTTCN